SAALDEDVGKASPHTLVRCCVPCSVRTAVWGSRSPAPDVITIEVPPWRQRRADPRSQAIDSPNLTWCVADRSWSRPSHLAVTRIPPSCPKPLIAAHLARED